MNSAIQENFCRTYGEVHSFSQFFSFLPASVTKTPLPSHSLTEAREATYKAFSGFECSAEQIHKIPFLC